MTSAADLIATPHHPFIAIRGKEDPLMERLPIHTNDTLDVPPAHHAASAEQEAHAAELINRALDSTWRNGVTVDTATARLIAATLHAGTGSHLGQFASSGELDARAALDEMSHSAPVDIAHLAWAAALREFLEERSQPEGTR